MKDLSNTAPLENQETNLRTANPSQISTNKLKWLIPGLLIVTLAVTFRIVSSRFNTRSVIDFSTVTVPAKEKQLTVKIEAAGSIVPSYSVNISPKNIGRLTDLYVNQGDEVKQGQILARMDSFNLQAQASEAKAKLKQAEAEYTKVINGNRIEEIRRAQAQVESDRAKVELSNLEVQRYQTLVTQGALARQELDRKLSEHKVNLAALERSEQQLKEYSDGSRSEDIELTKAKVEAAKAQLEVVKTNLEETVIRAPFDGIISQKYATVGSIITPTTSASSTASATSTSIVAITSGLEAKINVPEASISQIKTGQQVEIVADAYPQETFTAKVTQVAPEAVVQNNVTFFEVKLELIEGRSKLRSGMNVDATFIGQTKQALTIPTVAIALQNGEMGVMLLDEENQVQFQPVTVGLTQNGETEILDGLQSGERVFIDSPKQNKRSFGNR
ncbi:MAG: efflux RND transporter periplasmic adaptor subunit [Prochloraceae cyanobacterium]